MLAHQKKDTSVTKIGAKFHSRAKQRPLSKADAMSCMHIVLRRRQRTSDHCAHFLLSRICSTLFPLLNPSKELDKLDVSMYCSRKSSHLYSANKFCHDADTLVPRFKQFLGDLYNQLHITIYMPTDLDASS